MRDRIALAKALLRGTVARYAHDEGGNIILLFGIVGTALILFSGAALDYERSSQARTALQNAADAVVLGVARDAKDGASTDALKTLAASRMATMLPGNYAFSVKSVSTAGGGLTLTAEGAVPAGLTSVIGYSTLKQTVTSAAIWGTGKLEVALVLDSTGSMANFSRMVELKKAAAALLTALQSSEPGLVKVAIVPFDVNVRVPTSNKTASWFKSDWWVSWFWNGCIADRDQSNDVGDADVSGSSTKYPGALCSSNQLTTIQPLTDDFVQLNSKVNALTPAGNTNITIGLAWGMAVLSSKEPFAEGVAPGTPDVTKIIVLMTDGDNTENRWTSNASDINARTQLACQSAKTDGKILIYTVRLMEGNATLLENCASSPDNYYDVENAADLVPAFRAIGERISQLRLSM
jgi:Flp pilus assembly protein TadG